MTQASLVRRVLRTASSRLVRGRRRAATQAAACARQAVPAALAVEAAISDAEYAARRRSVLSHMPSHSVAIFPSAMQQFMSEDVPHLFHQNTDLMYLSGCAEAGAILVLDKTMHAAPRGRSPASLLFVEPRSAEREQWDGPMYGVSEATRAHFGVDDVLSTAALPAVLADRLTRKTSGGDDACKRVFLDPDVNKDVMALVGSLPAGEARNNFLAGWSRDTRPKHFVCRPRLVKSAAEAQQLRLACSAVAGGLNDAMANCVLTEPAGGGRRSVRERVIEAHVEFGAKMRGASRMAFPSVVASGSNGTVLHYMVNSSAAVDGDFVMVDAGCIVGGACSDVSRSWPVNGKFTGPQRDIYELLLDVQLRCIDMAREGVVHRGRKVSMNAMHALACEALTEGLLSLGFMPGMSVERALSSGAYQQWFGHSIGHYLGSDVHDTHSLSKEIALAEGMCVTVEPGLYIRADDCVAPAAFRGLGMRLEDDVLVRGGGAAAEVLSREAAKSVADIEALVGSGGDRSAPGGLLVAPLASAG